MSGFEVAGLIIGTIPLVVKAIDAYIGFLRDWGKTVSELKSVNRQLTTERARLYNVCDQLLGDMAPPGDVEPMLQDPFGTLWEDKQVNDKIRTRLWGSHEPFEQTVLEVREALDSIVQRLRVDIISDGQVKWVERRWMPREFKKFLHRLNRKDYADSLDTIVRAISTLEGLTLQSVNLEPQRKKRSRGKVIRILRDLSKSIHRALCSSIICDGPHDVGLELAPQLMNIAHNQEDDKVLHKMEFTISISFQIIDGPAKKIFWDEVNVKTTLSADVPSPSPSPSPTPTPLPLLGAVSAKSKRPKFVSFANLKQEKWSYTNPKASTSATETPTGGHITTNLAATHPANQPRVHVSTTVCFDLCDVLQKSRISRPSCYGRLSIISLHDVLKGIKGIHPFMGLEAKYRLSLTVAFSVLQLSRTPWLPGTLTSKNLYFLNRGGSVSYHSPLLLKSFPDILPLDGLKFQHPAQTTGYTINNQNPTLFALGILLLEIILGSTMGQLREPRDIVPGLVGDRFHVAAIQDAMTAHRLLEQRVSLINPLYKTVVERCIGCTTPEELDEEGFRQKVYGGVVMQLEEILEYTKL
ncbi:hypothetical protein QBC44DRAFT_340281 [Cladorrhinum sp. PSN332]|nr:hypothetical protein QBC44DRAFT_340281 [Cladorrhinum sp. PSN332]